MHCKYNIGLIMYTHHHGLLPNIFYVFTKKSNINQYDTRQSDLLHVPYCRTELVKWPFKYNAVIIWNRICKNIAADVMIGIFELHLKCSLLQSSVWVIQMWSNEIWKLRIVFLFNRYSHVFSWIQSFPYIAVPSCEGWAGANHKAC